MNNVVLARIFDSVTSEFTLGQIFKTLNMSVDEILDGKMTSLLEVRDWIASMR